MGSLKDFYLNKEPNPNGLYLKDLWHFSDWEFENTHDFIQWMFPLELKSNHSKTAPVVSKKDLEEMLNDPDVRKNLLKSLNVAEDFWGFTVEHQSITGEKPVGFKRYDSLNWPALSHHNYIRISRVIHSLKIFGLDKEAQELYEFLENEFYAIYRLQVGQETLESWKNALKMGPQVA